MRLITVFLVAMAAMSAHAADPVWPDRPVKLVTPFPAGPGPVDTIARLLGERLSRQLGQPFVVEPRPGASGNIAAEYVAKAPADGYTLLVGTVSQFATNGALFKNLPFDAGTDLHPLAFLGEEPFVLATNAKAISDAKSLITRARSAANAVSISTGGVGSSPHIAGELFQRAAQIQMLHVPYKGGVPAMNDMLAGIVDVTFVTVPHAASMASAGKLIPLAVTSDSRSDLLPNTPTVRELGLRGAEFTSWYGIAALIAGQFEVARQLMDMPVARKRELSISRSPTMRGFEDVGAQKLDSRMHPDLKESFYCGPDWPADHALALARLPTYGPNQWPEELPNVRIHCLIYIEHLTKLADQLMQLLARSLNLSETFFAPAFVDPMITLRMLRYPTHPDGADDRTFGAGSHTDWGALTLLAQDAHGGLEVELPDGRWVQAPPVADTFVVNLGDMIPRWTNGRYRSNHHRVLNNVSRGAPRFSIPFFYEPNYNARIEPAPGTTGDRSPLFAPCSAGEHLKEMYRQSYPELTP